MQHRTAAFPTTIVDKSAMNRVVGREDDYAFNGDSSLRKEGAGGADAVVMDQGDPMLLEGLNGDDESDSEFDPDHESWEMMDQADQEAVEQEEALSCEYESTSSRLRGESNQWQGGVRNNQDDDDGRASSPVMRRNHHRADSHRFIISPENTPKIIEIVVTMDVEDWADDDGDDLDDSEYGSQRLHYDKLNVLMRRSDQSRRCLLLQSLPTRFYGSSSFFAIALERQQLRRIMHDA